MVIQQENRVHHRLCSWTIRDSPVLVGNGKPPPKQYFRVKPALLEGLFIYQLVEEVDSFYLATKRTDYPIAFVLMIRNYWINTEDPDLPPWKVMKNYFEGWK